MERNVIVIEAAGIGWRVADAGSGSETYATKAKAIMAAYAQASERQLATGRAVTIEMPADWGGTVLVGAQV